MRTLVDLVAELQETARGARGAALIIGFEQHTEFVWSHDPYPLATLNSHVGNDGEPLGILRVYGEEGRVQMRPLQEFAEQEWVEKYLLTLRGDVIRSLRQNGIAAAEGDGE
jgi:hypothetical protein